MSSETVLRSEYEALADALLLYADTKLEGPAEVEEGLREAGLSDEEAAFVRGVIDSAQPDEEGGSDAE